MTRVTLAEMFSGRDRRHDEILFTMTPERGRLPRAHLQYSLQRAEFVAILGHNNRTFDWLENAIHVGVVNYPFVFARDPFLSNLRRDRRFEPLMAQVKAVWVR